MLWGVWDLEEGASPGLLFRFHKCFTSALLGSIIQFSAWPSWWSQALSFLGVPLGGHTALAKLPRRSLFVPDIYLEPQALTVISSRII